jgi:DNA-binding CsgD family transcriptional regulator
MGDQDLPGPNPLGGLTDKQREVLDLLLEHKTSKEIARLLRISPHTVDQRIQFAKDKLGASSRSEAAVAYRRLLETYERTTYDDSGIAPGAARPDIARRDRAPIAEPKSPQWTRPEAVRVAEADYQVVQGIFDGPHGTLVRLGTIGVLAVLITLLVLGGLATLAQLSQLLRG